MTALSVRDLRVRLGLPHGVTEVVRGISFDLLPGQITGLVGESGSGKTLTARAVMGLLTHRQAHLQARQLRLEGQSLLGLSEAQWRQIRGRTMCMIFQDPAAALDPVLTIGQQLKAVLRRQLQPRGRLRSTAARMLEEVGFSDAGEVLNAYPHELSGGMKQLVMIAMASAARPRVLLADEPTTALDASTRTLVMRQLQHLAQEHGTAVLLISHDLRGVTDHAQEMMVMYCGRLVERGPAKALEQHPHHPYLAGLLASSPTLGDTLRPVKPIPGQIPSVGEHLTACAFAPRCERATRRCLSVTPELSQGARSQTACHHPL